MYFFSSVLTVLHLSFRW